MKLFLAVALTIALLAPAANGFFFWFQTATFTCLRTTCRFSIRAYNARTDEVYWHTEPRYFKQGETYTIRNQGMANPPQVKIEWWHDCHIKYRRGCEVIRSYNNQHFITE